MPAETTFTTPKQKLADPSHLAILLGGLLFAAIGFLMLSKQPLLSVVFIPIGLLISLLPLLSMVGGITYTIKDDGLLIKRPIAHERFFPFSVIVSVERITSDRAAEVVKEAYQKVEDAKYKAAVTRSLEAGLEKHVREMHAAYSQMYHSRPMFVGITGSVEARSGERTKGVYMESITYIPGVVDVVPKEKKDCVLLTVKWKDELSLHATRSIAGAALTGTGVVIPTKVAAEDEPMRLILNPEQLDEFVTAMKQRMAK